MFSYILISCPVMSRYLMLQNHIWHSSKIIVSHNVTPGKDGGWKWENPWCTDVSRSLTWMGGVVSMRREKTRRTHGAEHAPRSHRGKHGQCACVTLARVCVYMHVIVYEILLVTKTNYDTDLYRIQPKSIYFMPYYTDEGGSERGFWFSWTFYPHLHLHLTCT